MTVLGVLSESVRCFAESSWRLFLVAGVVLAPLYAAEVAIEGDWWTALVFFDVLVALPIVQGAIADSVLRSRLGGSAVGLGSYRRIAPRALLLVVANLAYLLGFLAGLVLLVVPGLIVAAFWSVFVPALVNEREIGLGLGRSGKLIRGRIWLAFWLWLILLIPSFTPLCVEIAWGVSFTTLVAGNLVTFLVVTFQAVVAAVFYQRLLTADEAERELGYAPRAVVARDGHNDAKEDAVITRVRSVGIYVSDQQRALDFYTQVLGCQVLQDVPMGEGPDAPRWIEVRLPRDDVNLLLFTPQGQESRVGTFSNVIFHCDDLHATYEELHAKGVEFPTPPEQAPWGKWWATFTDPDGNVYGLALESEL